jgi:hypothetical protein
VGLADYVNTHNSTRIKLRGKITIKLSDDVDAEILYLVRTYIGWETCKDLSSVTKHLRYEFNE